MRKSKTSKKTKQLLRRAEESREARANFSMSLAATADMIRTAPPIVQVYLGMNNEIYKGFVTNLLKEHSNICLSETVLGKVADMYGYELVLWNPVFISDIKQAQENRYIQDEKEKLRLEKWFETKVHKDVYDLALIGKTKENKYTHNMIFICSFILAERVVLKALDTPEAEIRQIEKKKVREKFREFPAEHFVVRSAMDFLGLGEKQTVH